MSLPGAMRREIVRRAGNRCEYCQLSQAGQEAAFHIDHIDPVASGGSSEPENLALACVSCSLRKGAKRKALDPSSRTVAFLFHPRQQTWDDHFLWKNHRVRGIPATGRATVDLLKMNRALAVAIRVEESLLGRHPPR